MVTFVNHFFVCNLLIAIFIVLIFTLKYIFKNYLSARLQYNLWLVLLILLTIPFIPIRLKNLYSFFTPFILHNFSATEKSMSKAVTTTQTSNFNLLNDFTISVNQLTPSLWTYVFGIIWIMGMLTMVILLLKSRLNIYRIEQSALPLQNKKVSEIFEKCKIETNVKRTICIYSTPYLKSPIMVGMIKPRIYMPLHIISDLNEKEIRYMLLHELQHYKHFDPLINCLTNFYRIIYWFHPLIWYSLKEIRNDREIACDFSVLQMIEEDEYEDYGNTLINFAEKTSSLAYPFATGIGGNQKQITKRILKIACYRPQSFQQKIKGWFIYGIIVALILSFAPILSAYASEEEHYHFHPEDEKVSYVDFSSFFDGYNGSFVLYDTKANTWQIYNESYATMRVSPNSSYKIYDALIGLESGIITPNRSEMKWDGTEYPFDMWNADQTLNTAMQNSVNWYFQNIDRKVGISTVKNYIEKIGYGNKRIDENFPSYWLESSLKISPVEQVELLRKFYYNDFKFNFPNIDAVKNALRISASGKGTIFGKTGTGRVNNQDINGWFVGYVEKSNATYFFTTNIQSDKKATGKTASDITFSILSELHIWN